MHRVMGDPDAELWRKTAAGSADAFTELYRRHSRRLYNYAFRRLGDWAEAEDLLAEVFLEAYRRRCDAAIEPDRIVAWLFGVATNLAHNRRRARLRGRRLLERVAGGLRREGGLDTAERLDAEESMRALLKRVRALPREQQDVVALCIWSGLSYADAATALSIPVGTVRSRLARARAALAELEGGSRHGLVRGAEETT